MHINTILSGIVTIVLGFSIYRVNAGSSTSDYGDAGSISRGDQRDNFSGRQHNHRAGLKGGLIATVIAVPVTAGGGVGATYGLLKTGKIGRTYKDDYKVIREMAGGDTLKTTIGNKMPNFKELVTSMSLKDKTNGTSGDAREAISNLYNKPMVESIKLKPEETWKAIANDVCEIVANAVLLQSKNPDYQKLTANDERAQHIYKVIVASAALNHYANSQYLLDTDKLARACCIAVTTVESDAGKSRIVNKRLRVTPRVVDIKTEDTSSGKAEDGKTGLDEVDGPPNPNGPNPQAPNPQVPNPQAHDPQLPYPPPSAYPAGPNSQGHHPNANATGNVAPAAIVPNATKGVPNGTAPQV